MQRTITVAIGEQHPWETESGRTCWYTLIWSANGSINKTHLSVGQRSVSLTIPERTTVVCAAYALGAGHPFGGAYNPLSKDSDKIILSMEYGPLADALIEISKLWPDPVALVNFDRIATMISQIDEHSLSIDWNMIGKAIVSGAFTMDDIVKWSPVEMHFEGLPPGKWVCEHPAYSDIYSFSEGSNTYDNLYPGLLRFLCLERNMELRVLVPEQEPGVANTPFWHITTADPLFLLSDAAYLELSTR
ncbi:MAG: hypothetical protein PHR01_08520 [Sphaerochaetaceae bacterium]|nr:hypothetical protein [Sphaerochaetaceae bacterium]